MTPSQAHAASVTGERRGGPPRALLQPTAPIFVVGHPRSGTTLLASMLGRHPEIASTPESLFLTQARYPIMPVLGRDVAAIAARIERTPLRHLAGDTEQTAALLRALPRDRHGRIAERDLFAAVLEAYRLGHGKGRVLEKSPLHMRHIGELLAWFPDARILWIIRDGRACVASLQKVDWATRDARILARQWVRNMAFALDAERRAGPAMMRVRYERLVRDPRAEMAAILAFVGVAPSEAMHDHGIPVPTVKAREKSWKANVNKPLIGERAEAWRVELDRADLAAVSAVMDPMLRRFSYEPEPSTTRSVTRTAEWLRAAVIYSEVGIGIMRTAFHLTRSLDAFARG